MKNRLKGLALTLSDGERFLVAIHGMECWVGVSKLPNGKTRVVVDAPRNVKVLREQLVLLQEANRCPQL